MHKDEARIKRLFPSYFELFKLPDGAGEEEIQVYRACKTCKCDKESFTPSYEEKEFKHNEGDDPDDPGQYSLSTYEKPKDCKRFVKLNSEFQKPYKIAFGITHPQYGLVQRTKERKIKYKSSHVDYWLYEEATPYEKFEMIEDFDSYLEIYKKEREGGNWCERQLV